MNRVDGFNPRLASLRPFGLRSGEGMTGRDPNESFGPFLRPSPLPSPCKKAADLYVPRRPITSSAFAACRSRFSIFFTRPTTSSIMAQVTFEG